MLVTTTDEARRFRDASRGAQVPFYLRHWISVFSLAAADVLAFAIAAVLFRIWRHEPHIWVAGLGGRDPRGLPIDVFALLTVLFVFLRAVAGDYSRREPFWDGVRSTVAAIFLVSLPDVVVVVSLGHGRYSVWGSLESWLSLVVLVPVLRQGARRALSALGLWRRRTALIGTGHVAQIAYGALSNSLSLGFDIQWAVAVGGATSIPEELAELKTMASNDIRDAGLLVQAAGCDQAILAMDEADRLAYPELIQRLSEADVETAIIPPLARLPMGNLTTSVIFGKNVLLFQVRDNLRRWPHRVFKRVFDFVGALFGLAVLSPFLLLVAFLVKRQDGGPATYAQVRIGREGVPFRCIKFRTMHRDADEILARWREENPSLYEEFQKTFKLRDDPRVTPLGKWLRRTSLDELPQLVNILRGEMSFVGPRPVVEKELLDYYGPAAQLYMRVRPGLTGLWQVSGRSDTGYEERIAFDEWYILNWSIWYDLIIIAQTFGVMISGHGAY